MKRAGKWILIGGAAVVGLELIAHPAVERVLFWWLR